ncbi:iron complex transport system substrate-binding protein [Pseudonocardia hierapolitana]|uniref:Iron complex transport system substrate-binding protein n=1 Tax=Pseudonocardia hierapolitana TaxID=1128676 RepID=A0A561SP73_9PSEU|nr:ABC transporter substrate-binding protein [Pseudonocardia hierapolitana]TWF76657.1 iron complex transport system substrate-binding protein [Pseudonocardia hierapolitana]
MGRFRSGVAVVVGVVLVAGCGAGPERGTGSIVVDSCGREVVFDTSPERVLAIGSEAPGLLVAAGAGAAVTHYAGTLEAPFGAEVRPVVERAERVLEDSHDLSFETIVGTGADVAIGTDISSATDINALADRLAQAGVQLLTVSGYCAVNAASVEGLSEFELIYRDIEAYGRLFGTEQVAAKAIEGLRERVAAVEERTAGRSGRSAIPLYVTADGPLGAYGGQALVSEQMRVLGLANVFDDVQKRYFEPNSEEIVSSAPDLVFAMYVPTGSSALESESDVVAELRGRPELAGLGAMADDRALLPLNYFYTSASPLAVDGLELLADQIAGA